MSPMDYGDTEHLRNISSMLKANFLVGFTGSSDSMITAAGAGASFCLATPSRLRPQNQRNPRLIATGGQASQTQVSLATYNQGGGAFLQRAQSAASNYSQASSSNYSPSFVPPIRSNQSPEVTETSQARPFLATCIPPTETLSQPCTPHPVFRSQSFSASSAALYHDALMGDGIHSRPRTPNSVHSYATASSDRTARPFASSSKNEPIEIFDDDLEISPTSPAAPGQFQSYMTNPLPGLPSYGHTSQLGLKAIYPGNTNDLLQLQSFVGVEPLETSLGNIEVLPYSVEQAAEEICIVVLGVENSGKSSFIKAYNGPKCMPISGVSQRAYRLGDSRYVVRLVEMDLRALDIRNSQFTWPSLHDGTEIMTADGILVIFDVTDSASMENIPDVLDFFFKADIPTILVASKCDAPTETIELHPNAINEIKDVLGVEVLHTSSSDDGQSQKRCVSMMLSTIVQRKKDIQNIQANIRRRTNSSSFSSRSISPRSDPRAAHGRASSEISANQLRHQQTAEAVKGHRGRTFRSKSASNTNALSPTRTSHSTPASPLANKVRAYTQDFNPYHGKDTLSDNEDSFSYLDIDSAAYNSMSGGFLRSKSTSASTPVYDQEGFDSTTSLNVVMQEHEGKRNNAGAKYQGMALEELVKKLLAYPMCKADHDFSTLFLCFYRKFAAPVDLLSLMLARFDSITQEESILLLQMNEKVRLLSKLHTWVFECPSDFANPSTRQRTIEFARTLESNRTFAGMAKDIIAILRGVSDDEDAIWGKKDTDLHRFSMPVYLTIQSGSRNGSVVSSTSYKSAGSDENSVGSPVERLRRDSHLSITPSFDSNGGIMKMQSLIDGLPQMSPSIIKEQYSFFIELNDEDVAHELTRIDWSLFSRVKPRDFVRHISVPAAEKDRIKSLKYVNRLMRHFNRVAFWVASVILERPKAKHRARALEKFMNIAWILRHMNNYNSLGAVIAGVNGLAIHRLALTRSLVNEAVHKNFMRLELLMGTHKSHFAYRLALENTTRHHIPFIPLHRRDLVSAEESNRSFLEDGVRINWRKFETMGEVMLILLNSQAAPHKDLRPNPVTNQLLFDATGTMSDDQLMEGFQDLYEKSVQAEPGSANVEMQRAKRNWFKR